MKFELKKLNDFQMKHRKIQKNNIKYIVKLTNFFELNFK